MLKDKDYHLEVQRDFEEERRERERLQLLRDGVHISCEDEDDPRPNM